MLRKRKLDNNSHISSALSCSNINSSGRKSKKPVIKLHRIHSSSKKANKKIQQQYTSIKSYFPSILMSSQSNTNQNLDDMQQLFKAHCLDETNMMIDSCSITHPETVMTTTDYGDNDDEISQIDPECGKCQILPTLDNDFKSFSQCNNCKTSYCSQCKTKALYICCDCEETECEQCAGFDVDQQFDDNEVDLEDDEFSFSDQLMNAYHHDGNIQHNNSNINDESLTKEKSRTTLKF